MGSITALTFKAGIDDPSPFKRSRTQVCFTDGRPLSECTLTRQDHDVETLSAAKLCVREDLSDYQGERLIVVVSEDTLTKLRQVQLRVVVNEACST